MPLRQAKLNGGKAVIRKGPLDDLVTAHKPEDVRHKNESCTCINCKDDDAEYFSQDKEGILYSQATHIRVPSISVNGS